MSVASPALALASTDVQSFRFPRRAFVKIQVRFYTDADGTAGNEIAPGSGSRTVTITTVTPSIVDAARETVGTDVLSAIKDGAQTCDGAMWVLFGLGDGLQQLNVAATAGANPGAATSYRIWLDIEPNG